MAEEKRSRGSRFSKVHRHELGDSSVEENTVTEKDDQVDLTAV